MNLRLVKKLANADRSHKNYRHAALVYKGGALVAMGHNIGTVHAEVHALKKLWPDHRRHTVVVSLRMTKSGTLAMAKPCPECERYMRQAGVKKVVYSNSSGQTTTVRL